MTKCLILLGQIALAVMQAMIEERAEGCQQGLPAGFLLYGKVSGYSGAWALTLSARDFLQPAFIRITAN
jgi:hypothetical protein